MNNMENMHISGTEPLSVILGKYALFSIIEYLKYSMKTNKKRKRADSD